MAKMKKSEDGISLRKGQYKRLGRIAERNPERAEKVAERMKKRDSRLQRGKEIANPRRMEMMNKALQLKEKELNAHHIKSFSKYKEFRDELRGQLSRSDRDSRGNNYSSKGNLNLTFTTV